MDGSSRSAERRCKVNVAPPKYGSLLNVFLKALRVAISRFTNRDYSHIHSNLVELFATNFPSTIQPFRPLQVLHCSASFADKKLDIGSGRKDIHIDSNTTFHLKCLSADDFNKWMSAFRFAPFIVFSYVFV